MKLSEIIKQEYKNTVSLLEIQIEKDRTYGYKLIQLQEDGVDVRSDKFVNELAKGAYWERAVKISREKIAKLTEELKNALFVEKELNE